MTGMALNTDLMRMTWYAPLFGSEETWPWRPGMIAFDHLKACGSANDQVQNSSA